MQVWWAEENSLRKTLKIFIQNLLTCSVAFLLFILAVNKVYRSKSDNKLATVFSVMFNAMCYLSILCEMYYQCLSENSFKAIFLSL